MTYMRSVSNNVAKSSAPHTKVTTKSQNLQIARARHDH